MHARSTEKVASFRGAEYVENNELQEWQAEVLETFFKECPKAFEEFKGHVFQEFLDLKSLADNWPDLQPFRDVFLKWLRRYRFDQCEWIVDALLDSLGDLDQFPELFKDEYRADRNRAGWLVTSEPFRFEFRGFELNGESREKYQVQLEQHLKAAIEQHFTKAQQLAAERGLKVAKDRDPVHFKWLIQYLCRNWTYKDIGSKGRPRATADAVRKAIRRLAEELAIPLPEAPKGRPRGS
ncbi:MAG: hypothetical protein FJW36_11855 [Acidobacteria bacterium]|nr:hypothetical protein [Acidobacteriota bacterium]